MKNEQREIAGAPHLPVMLEEVLHFFKDKEIKVFFDGTLGAGGHAKAILEAHPEIQTYIACDRDPDALKLAASVLSPWKSKIEFVHGDFADLDQHVKRAKVKSVDGFFLTWGSPPCS